MTCEGLVLHINQVIVLTVRRYTFFHPLPHQLQDFECGIFAVPDRLYILNHKTVFASNGRSGSASHTYNHHYDPRHPFLLFYLYFSTHLSTNIMSYEPLAIASWLVIGRETEPGAYTPTPLHPETHSHHRNSGSDSTPRFARAPPTWPPNSVRRRPRSPSSLSEPAPTRTQLPYLLNSGCRSTWELLKALPDPSDITKALPTLPTHYFTPSELDNQLPDPFLAPLVSTKTHWYIL